MQFFTLDNAIDRELELVPPSARFIDDMLKACQHPHCWNDQQAAWTRQQLISFVNRHPNGIEHGNDLLAQTPAYHFWMRLRPATHPPIPIAGTISFRVANTDHIRLYSGHIGYGVFPPARGRHYSQRAVQLIQPLARAHGMDHLWITCNPDNLASRRTCEKLGAKLVEIIDIPDHNPLYLKGERQKCRYQLAI
jgi:tagatose 1,6-diphosphate aldolase